MTYHGLHCGSLSAFTLVLLSTTASFAQAGGGSATERRPTPTRDPGALTSPDGPLLSLPIRLSLSGHLVPLAPLFPQCTTLEDDVGNSVARIPVHGYAEWRPMPRLRLAAFSQLGCPIDAGLGALMLYSVPLHNSTSLEFATGIYGVPAQFDLFGGLRSSLRTGLRGAASPIASDARVDLTWQSNDGSAYGIGVESAGTASKRLTFSGGF
jgi:hypothetical protein